MWPFYRAGYARSRLPPWAWAHADDRELDRMRAALGCICRGHGAAAALLGGALITAGAMMIALG